MSKPKVYSIGQLIFRLEEDASGELILTMIEPDYDTGEAKMLVIGGQQEIGALQAIAQDARLWAMPPKTSPG